MKNKTKMFQFSVLVFILLNSYNFAIPVNSQFPVITIDGEISANEYSFDISFKDDLFILYWEVVGVEIYFGMTAQTTGYIGINIAPGIVLNDADIYYGFTNTSGTYMVDTYSDSIFGPTEPDISDGGTDDILEYKGKEVDGQTTFEFRRLLVTPDTDHDNEIILEETLIAWTIGPNDDITERPADSDRYTVNFLSGQSEEATDYTLYYIIGGVVVVVLLVLGVGIWYFRKRRIPKVSE